LLLLLIRKDNCLILSLQVYSLVEKRGSQMGRIVRFIKEWVRLALLGKSLGEKVAKPGSLLAGLGLSFFFKQQVTLVLATQPQAISLVSSIGRLCIGILAFTYLVVTAGMAWVGSVGPYLLVGDELEFDPDYQTWRLRVTNKGHKPVMVIVEMDKIWSDCEGAPTNPAIFPLQLEWSDTNQVSKQELPYDRPKTVTVVMLELQQTILKFYLRVWGATYRHFLVPLDGVQKVYCELSIYCPDYPHSIKRRFSFERDADDHLKFKVSGIKGAAWKQLTSGQISPIPKQDLDPVENAKVVIASDSEKNSTG
jgi:hypothetical protein